jgi:uncharacterized protein
MNEQANIDIIRSIYAAFNAADGPGIMSLIAEGASWHNQGAANVPYSGSYNGKTEIPRFFQAIAESTTGGEVVAEEYIAQGERVVALGRYRATVRDTGAQIDCPIAHVFSVRDGKVVSWEGYSDTAQVAAAHTRQTASASR